ncbi:MAG: serine/threonine-protein kinase, partial [Deltaproteobacteria bacterium]|nr:serine/threonine-protein kinase [Deltaproteobacteria bacterium]
MTRPETSLRDLVGEEFGPYKLVRRLGIGGMAETFEAIRSGPSGFQQRVCLKLVLPFFQDDENFIELFQREAKLAARLRHSNIVGVIDFGEAGGRYYMALELVDGCDLRTLLDAQDRTRLPWEHVTLIGLDLSAGLEHAHHPSEQKAVDESGSHVQAIVHRDISPGNVLISRRGEILLTDFGVAKAITGTARKQSTVKGKIPYMSPEQLKGEVVDGRADLFALGVVLFEAMSGRRPYEGAHDPATIMLTLSGEHPSLRELAPEAPDGLCEVIESLLDPDVERRPQTAAVLIESLDDFAPPRRIRRKLGEMVAETAQAAELLARDVSSAVVENARRRAAAGEAPTVRTLEGSDTKSRRRAV